jgi:TPR repeat protein
LAYGQRLFQENDEGGSRSSEAWLSSLLTSPSDTPYRDNRDARSQDDGRAEIQGALSSLKRMMQAQQRHNEDYTSHGYDNNAPLMASLAAMQSQMAHLVATLNTPQPVASRGRVTSNSLLHDIESRQAEIMGGQKKPLSKAPSYQANQGMMREDLSALGHALADVVPQKTVDALRNELRKLTPAPQKPQDLTAIHDSLAMLARHLEDLSQKKTPEINEGNERLERKIEQLTRELRETPQQLDLSESNALLERKFEQLTRQLRETAPQKLKLDFSESNALLERKFEQLTTQLRDNAPQKIKLDFTENHALLERKFEQLAQQLRESTSQPQQQSGEIERVFSILLQKIEATDRKIEQLNQRDTPPKPASIIEERSIIAPSPVEVTPVPKAIDRLQERFKPTENAPAPVARPMARPIDTGTTAFDMPLEPGTGSPKLRPQIARADEMHSIPMARMSFEHAVEPSIADVEKSKSLQSLLVHKNKILIGLAALLLAFGGLKALDMMAPAPKKAASLQEMPVTPVKKIEMARIEPSKAQDSKAQASKAQEDAKLFAPNGIDPIITGSNNPAPRAVPGVAVNNGWSPIVSPEEKNTLKNLADNGNPSAQFEMANRMFDGKLLPKNEAGAIALYQKASEQNFAPAQFRLGSLYEKGMGVAKDREAARKLYLSAAGLGHAKSMHNLAVLSADNTDGKGDLKVATQWFRKAAEHGVTDSQYNLAVLYARGLGVEQSTTESYKWFALAALGGDTDAGVKRDDLAKRLSSENLSAAKIAVESFIPRKEPESAIRVDLPTENTQNSLLTRQITGKKI